MKTPQEMSEQIGDISCRIEDLINDLSRTEALTEILVDHLDQDEAIVNLAGQIVLNLGNMRLACNGLLKRSLEASKDALGDE